MTTIDMQPGEHDLATDLLGAVVLGLTFGLVDLSAGDEDIEPGGTGGGIGRMGPCLVERADEDREIGG